MLHKENASREILIEIVFYICLSSWIVVFKNVCFYFSSLYLQLIEFRNYESEIFATFAKWSDHKYNFVPIQFLFSSANGFLGFEYFSESFLSMIRFSLFES